MRRRAAFGPVLGAVLALLGAGCAVGPDYVRPPVVTPDAYKENAGWKVAAPRDDEGAAPGGSSSATRGSARSRSG